MIGAGHIARNRKGDHAVATGRRDTRTLTRKRLNGLIECASRAICLAFGLSLELKLFVAAFGVVFHGVFELVKVILEAVFDRCRRSGDGTQCLDSKMAAVACFSPVKVSNR